MEEERRLCYVGMTRAREELYMLYTVSRMLFGAVQQNPPSRFLSEVDADFKPDAGIYGQGGQSGFGQSIRKLESTAEPEDIPVVPNDEPRYVPELYEGDTVKHALFGVGQIMEMDGDNATIYFKGKGAKKLNIGFAPISKVE